MERDGEVIRFASMKKRICVLTTLILFLFAGCTAAPESPTPLPVESPTPTIQSTLTPSPLPTATKRNTPTATPEFLRTDGPILAYFREVNGQYQFELMDADGEGREAVALPDGLVDSFSNKQFDLDVQRVSPDGRWLAFYKGSAGEDWVNPEQNKGPFDLSLNLLDLKTGEVKVVASLLSEDYPANFLEAEKQLNNSEITAVQLQGAFIAGIRALAWSPDGKFLAFAGQMEGLSSDLYVYELGTGEIRRLSSGDQELKWIKWSPDGKWILHGSAFEFGMGTLYDIYAASLDGTSVKYLAKASATGEWLNPQAFIVYDNQNVFGDFEFRLVDIETGSVRKIWDGPLMSYALNADKAQFAAVAHMFDYSPYLGVNPDLDFVPGLYLIDLSTFEAMNIKTSEGSELFGYYASSFDVGDSFFAFTGFGTNQNPYLLSETGEWTMLDIKRVDTIKGSPDDSYWIAITDKVINIYSGSNIQLNSIPLPPIDIQRTAFVWKPDSSGFYFVHESGIYSVNVATSEINLIEGSLLNDQFGSPYKWIGNQ